MNHGARTLHFKRQIDHKSCQFEFQDNLEIVTHTKSWVLERIKRKEITVVCTDLPVPSDASVAKGDIFLDVASLTEEERKIFEWRLAYVKGMRKRGITRGQRHRIAAAILDIARSIEDGAPPRASAIMGWMREYERSDDNPYVLISRRRLVPHSSPIMQSINDLVQTATQDIYLNRERRSVRQVSVHVAATIHRMKVAGQLPENESGRASISQRTIYRRIQKIDPFERDRKRLGETHARNKWRYSLNTEVAIYPMQRVEVDHTQLDIHVLDDRLGILLGRPWITVLVDRYSGYILGFYISFAGPSIQAALGAIKASIRPKGDIVSSIGGIEHMWLAEGIAALYVFDNGLEFKSALFRAIIQYELRAEAEFCAVYCPWLKPSVERCVGLFNQHALPRRGHTHVLESWSDFNPTKHAAISFSELCQILVRWVTDIHPFAVNDRKIARPYDLFADGLAFAPIPQFCVDDDRLDFVAAIRKSCTVNKNGVAFARLQYHSTELKDIPRSIKTSFKTYMKFDPEDIGRIYVQHPKTEDWITVPCTRPDYAESLSLKQHQQIKKFRWKKLNQRHDVDGYVEALMKFQEHIQSMVAGRPSVRTSSNAGKFVNMTSSKVFAGQPQSILDSKTSRIVAKEDFAQVFHDIPNFEVRYAD